MAHSLKDIAAALGAEALGAADILIYRVSEPASAGPNDLALATSETYADQLKEGQARAAMLWPGADWKALGLDAALIAPRPRFAMSGLTAMMEPDQGFESGVHETAQIHPEAILAAGVSVGPLAVVSAGARIGAGTVIGPQCYVGRDAQLGDFCFLREQVSIGARAQIGDRFIAHPGVRIAGDGFSFVTPEPSGVEKARETLGDQGEAQAQTWAKIHSLGAVRIGNDVEMGANTCVDCGTVRDTIIGNGCKFDNLAQIGHNVVIGNDSLICAQVGIAGSSRIGNNVVLGGQTGISDNVFVGDRAITGGATKVLSNVPEGRVMLGYPAMKMDSHIETYKALRRLPRLLKEVAALRKAVSKLGETD